MSADRVWRLWRQAKLQVPRKRARRRVASGRPRPVAPTGANQVWAYDFVFDACANGQQLKCLTVLDEYTCESLAIDVAGSLRSARVIEVLAQLISVRGALNGSVTGDRDTTDRPTRPTIDPSRAPEPATPPLRLEPPIALLPVNVAVPVSVSEPPLLTKIAPP